LSIQGFFCVTFRVA